MVPPKLNTPRQNSVAPDSVSAHVALPAKHSLIAYEPMNIEIKIFVLLVRLQDAGAGTAAALPFGFGCEHMRLTDFAAALYAPM